MPTLAFALTLVTLSLAAEPLTGAPQPPIDFQPGSWSGAGSYWIGDIENAVGDAEETLVPLAGDSWQLRDFWQMGCDLTFRRAGATAVLANAPITCVDTAFSETLTIDSGSATLIDGGLRLTLRGRVVGRQSRSKPKPLRVSESLTPRLPPRVTRVSFGEAELE